MNDLKRITFLFIEKEKHFFWEKLKKIVFRPSKKQTQGVKWIFVQKSMKIWKNKNFSISSERDKIDIEVNFRSELTVKRLSIAENLQNFFDWHAFQLNHCDLKKTTRERGENVQIGMKS